MIYKENRLLIFDLGLSEAGNLIMYLVLLLISQVLPNKSAPLKDSQV